MNYHTGESCGKCKFFLELSEDDKEYASVDYSKKGFCARYPNRILITTDYWCGEFKPTGVISNEEETHTEREWRDIEKVQGKVFPRSL